MRYLRWIFIAALLALPGSALIRESGPESAQTPTRRVASTQHDLTAFYRNLDTLIQQASVSRDFAPSQLDGEFRLRVRGCFWWSPCGTAPELYGSADLALLLAAMNELDERVSPASRDQWLRVLKGFQNPRTGYFDRGNSTWHSTAHATGYAVAAIRVLGGLPDHPLKYSAGLWDTPSQTATWFNHLRFNWQYVWIGAHKFGEVAAVSTTLGLTPAQLGNLIGWLDAHADPSTGFWKRGLFDDNRVALGGAAHVWWTYEFHGVDIRYPDKVIDSVLSLQLSSGLWSSAPYADFIDLDAVYALRLAHEQLERAGILYRTREVTMALERFLNASVPILNDSRTFSRHYRDTHRIAGAVFALTEANRFFRTHGGDRIITRRPWISLVPITSWY